MELATTPLGDTSVRITIDSLTRIEFIDRLASDVSVRRRLTDVLTAAPWPGFCLELPPLSLDSAARPAELVVVESRLLRRVLPDPRPFAEPLAGCAADVAVFTNLGGDAELVVPQPWAAPGSAHLAVFLRSARAEVIDGFWRVAAESARARVGREPLWVSTAGLGVHWLHLRLDRVPKYYRHEPYRAAGA